MHMSGQRHALALLTLERAIQLEHTESKAMMSWMLQHGREGVPVQRERAFNLVIAHKGSNIQCEHCQGALAHCILNGWNVMKDVDMAFMLARSSAVAGSPYGQFVLALALIAHPGPNAEETAAFVFRNLKLASDQGLPEARLGYGTALLAFFKDIEKEKAVVEQAAMKLFEQAAFGGSIAAQKLIGQIRASSSKTEDASDLATLTDNLRKNVHQHSRVTLLTFALGIKSAATADDAAAAPQSRKPASRAKAINGGTRVPSSAQASPSTELGGSKSLDAACLEPLTAPPPTAPAASVPAAIEKLGRLLGSQFCPHCDRNATIGSECAVSCAYHTL